MSNYDPAGQQQPWGGPPQDPFAGAALPARPRGCARRLSAPPHRPRLSLVVAVIHHPQQIHSGPAPAVPPSAAVAVIRLRPVVGSPAAATRRPRRRVAVGALRRSF